LRRINLTFLDGAWILRAVTSEAQRMADGSRIEQYLTADLPGTGGRIKAQIEDFLVEELPLYPPLGEGEHTFFEIRKAGLSTFQAIRLISKELGISPRRIGYAGLKDAQAITRQVLSVHGVSPGMVTSLDIPRIQVLWAERHRHKLKIGHLRGNRFTIRVQGTEASQMPACRSILDVLSRRGVPNRFGPQRFGMRGDSALLGQEVVRGRTQEFVQAFLGRPDPGESDVVALARSCFDAGRWTEALQIFPGSMVEERRSLQTLIRTQGDFQRAYEAVSKRLKTFLLSAYQSYLFNRVLDVRLTSLDRVCAGDLAMKHPGHSIFRVEDEEAEQPRATRFEISPTGPIYGYKMMQASGRQCELEAQLLAEEGLSLDDFRVGGGISARGERRALRFPVHEPELWYDGGLRLRFWLPRGCYATMVLAEIIKSSPQNLPGDPEADDSTADAPEDEGQAV
jgi:tRNA pseudouridine13 synthase